MERIILTENDADEFLKSIGVALYENSITIGETEVSSIVGQAALQEHGIFLYKDGVLIEGQQAEDYLNKKREKASEKAIEKDRFNSKYNSDSGVATGPRGMHSAEANYPPTAKNNPRYDTAREIRKHRSDYADVMPNRKSKSEKELSSAERKEILTSIKARNTVDRDLSRRLHIKDPLNMDGCERQDMKKAMNSAEYQAALDAARRHVRRHQKQYKEAAGIFSSINFI